MGNRCILQIKGDRLYATTVHADREGREWDVCESSIPLSDLAKALEPYLPTTPKKG